MPIGACIKVEYSGAAASCLLVGDGTGKTLTALVGDAGTETPDPAFGTAGVIDLTAAAADTLDELVALIDGYADYAAEVLFGDDMPTAEVLDQTVQAKGDPGYVLFELTSVLSPYALTTWARVREAQSHLKDSDQVFVERLINASTEEAESIACRQFRARASTLDLDGTGSSRLVLPVHPIIAVAHVYVDPLRVFGADTEVTSDILMESAKGTLIRKAGTFGCGVQVVRVDLTHGLDPIPERLQFAVIETVAWNLQRFRGAGQIGLRAAKGDEWDYSYELSIPLHARQVFESFRSVA